MKFTIKLIISVVATISVIFSIAGIVIVNKNFNHSLEVAVDKNIDGHLLERYGIEDNIVNNIAEDGSVSKEKLIQYAKGLISYFDNKMFSVSLRTEEVYSNIDISLNKTDISFFENAGDLKYLIKDVKNEKYIFVSSLVEINNNKITLLSVYNITDIFKEKDRQLSDFWKINIAFIISSSIALSILSVCLTKPIRKLNEASKKIVKGSYNERVKIETTDEIGQLATSFNIMVETIENKIAELELSVKQREEFISNFTHELKNPMTSIIGYSDLLRNGKHSDKIRKESVNFIFTEAKRLELLSHKLMDLMGLSDGNIEFEKIVISDFINDIKTNIAILLENTELELNVEAAVVIADHSLLEDCLRNLIDNAKKSIPRDNKIAILGQKTNDKYAISVIDKGCGISKTDLPRITESFYMVDKSRAKKDGRSGIGLAICEKIAKLHNSNLHIESELGKGTVVTLCLEVDEDEI